jgi:two-component system, chemotaxis family, chemotaxis protein CheY
VEVIVFEMLVVDDTKSVHSFLKSILAKAEGINITDVMNGAEAVDLLKAKKHFDLILLDWEMPVLNGPDTFDQFKAMDVRTPVIMMTTKNNPDDIARMLTAGVSEYMMKPFTVDILFEKIEFATGNTINRGG